MNAPLSTEEWLKALEHRIAGCRWEGAPAFGLVARYDQPDLTLALEELQSAADRVCLVLYEGDRYDTELRGRHLHMRRVAQVSLLLVDRHLTQRPAAVFGGVGNPGVVALKDQLMGLGFPLVDTGSDVAPTLPGLLLPGIYVKPMSATSWSLEDRTGTLAGRGAWRVRLELIGGPSVHDLGQQPFF